jgi:hypothetical protein
LSSKSKNLPKAKYHYAYGKFFCTAPRPRCTTLLLGDVTSKTFVLLAKLHGAEAKLSSKSKNLPKAKYHYAYGKFFCTAPRPRCTTLLLGDVTSKTFALLTKLHGAEAKLMYKSKNLPKAETS